MRLWSINPIYLDAKGLVALWREGLLAQKVLLGKTAGYTRHPQLNRFKNSVNPGGAIASYLRAVAAEADRRGYNFDKGRIANRRYGGRIAVTSGQLRYEWSHLLRKLKTRSSDQYMQLRKVKKIEAHPLFAELDGGVEDWEII